MVAEKWDWGIHLRNNNPPNISQLEVLFLCWASLKRCNATLTKKHAAYVMENWGIMLPMYSTNAQNCNMFQAILVKVLASMPSAMANQIDTFSTENKLLCVLSGLQGPHVREWNYVYRNIALPVHQMYLKRYQLYTSTISDNSWDLRNLCILQISCASVYILKGIS